MTEQDPTPDKRRRTDSRGGFGRLPNPMDRLRSTTPTWFPTLAMGEMALAHVQNVIADTDPHIDVLRHTYAGPTAVEGRDGVKIDTKYIPGSLVGARFAGDVLRGDTVDPSTGRALRDGLLGAAAHIRAINSTGGRFDPGRSHDLLLRPDQAAAVHKLEPGLTGVMIPHPEVRRSAEGSMLLEATVRLAHSAARLRELSPGVGLQLGLEIADTVTSIGQYQDERAMRELRTLQGRIGRAVEKGDSGLLRDLGEELRVKHTAESQGGARPIREFSSQTAQVEYMMGIPEGSGQGTARTRGLMDVAESLMRNERIVIAEREQQYKDLTRGRGDDDEGPGSARPSREPDGPGPRSGPSGRTPEKGPERGLEKEPDSKAADPTKHKPQGETPPKREQDRDTSKKPEGRTHELGLEPGGVAATQEPAPQVQRQSLRQESAARVPELEHGPSQPQGATSSAGAHANTQPPTVSREGREAGDTGRQPVVRTQSPFSPHMQRLLDEGRVKAEAERGIIGSRKDEFRYKPPQTKEQEAAERAREDARSAEVPAEVKAHSDARYADAHAARTAINSRADSLVAERGMSRIEALRLAEREHARQFGLHAPGEAPTRTARSLEQARDVPHRTR